MTNPNPNSTSYGLNIKPKKDTGVDKKATNNNVALELKLLEKFHEDIKKFPDDKGLEEFIGVPVNGYGKAVLAGYQDEYSFEDAFKPRLKGKNLVTLDHLTVRGSSIRYYILPDSINLETLLVEETT
ncbi:hypothetical protein IFM89_003640 [Coptis chinensis]|uniref:Uncharacterized protein n=1 Tax=Coptis chinensis TaxID=261450 RepID=A0A835M8J6_9MAGN|nr:hypothetical protein IFM89_003640 [Coptis chinensis]